MVDGNVTIPEKLFFKIGEVCDLVGVQAHVLRYWESEFSMLSPQKNKSGQRSYRRRDVEIAMRIKQLLYNEMFTIAGARKKLQAEQRENGKPKQMMAGVAKDSEGNPMLFPTQPESEEEITERTGFNGDQREALKVIAANLLEIREILKSPARTSLDG
jgi:DNA-binding transcriptional MerR regulator